ncbi:putative sodium-coupled neutral amino acid transporter 6 isoform X2 [Denticeps clupeoides]|uniref:Amino acid transporter transmembrane domain-containing protein n=1 Tax=Denticeps clupeoides TaxID=299321 RepID=A0AAY4CF20_9TELE|nr:probable sodium-coupled neutral amino acid transporter 6 isoform X2 [Denticeps clupeoides]
MIETKICFVFKEGRGGSGDKMWSSEQSEEQEQEPLLGQVRGGSASFSSSVFNLMNAIMGSGILGLAYAMANTGIIGFTLLLILVSSLAVYSIHLLLTLCDQTGISAYETLGDRAFGRPGRILVACTILVQNIGAMSSYMFILKSELPAVISSFLSPVHDGGVWYENGVLLLILVTVCVVLPLALLPKIGFLGYTSSLAFLFMLFFTVVVVLKKFYIPCPPTLNSTQIFGQNVSDCRARMFVISSKSVYAVPTMAFSFLCHTAILPIYCELQRATKQRMQQVTNVSISLSFILYFISALFGYLTFYNSVESELLLSYDVYRPRDVLVVIVRLAVLLAVLLTVPLIHFPARKAVLMLVKGEESISFLSHCLATFLLITTVVLLAVYVPDIRNIFGVVGSTTSTCLLFVYPGLFFLRVSTHTLPSPAAVGALCLVLFGVCVGFLSLVTITVSLVQS